MTSVPIRSARSYRRMLWPVIAATIAAAAAGAGIGTILVPGEPAAPPPRTADVTFLSGGVATMALPDGWKELRGSRIPGLERAASARALYSDVAIDSRMPDHSSLLPAPMLRRLGTPPKPTLLRSGDRYAWAYELPGPSARTRISALVLPTTGGVVTVACMAEETLAPYAAIDCEDALAGLELTGVAPVRPAPGVAVRIGAAPTIERLDDARSAARRALAATQSPRRRAAAAQRIAAAYARAARSLEPLADRATRPLTRVLGALARDHRLLAVASGGRHARAARRAGRAIDRHERRLSSLLAASSD